MKSRAWKYAALVVSGGVVLQISGCAQSLAEIGLSLFIRALLSGVLDALSGAAAQANGSA